MKVIFISTTCCLNGVTINDRYINIVRHESMTNDFIGQYRLVVWRGQALVTTPSKQSYATIANKNEDGGKLLTK